jgi:hypothetical protein
MRQSGDTAGSARQTVLASRLAHLLGAVMLAAGAHAAAEAAAAENPDPHYSEAGFFDIHVCNWPGRPLFFMPLFSTARYREVQRIEVLTPGGTPLGELDPGRYRTIRQGKKPDKRVFIQQLDVPPTARDGWYFARVTLNNGEVYNAQDFVIIHKLPQATGQSPANEIELAEIPAQLSWQPVPGANYYQVFIRDLWNDGKLLYTSELLDKPVLVLPPGLLEKGGYYSWIIHARDTNAHILLGDFNHGSMNTPVTFTVADAPGPL